MNEVLARFPALAAMSVTRHRRQGDVLIETGNRIKNVYFPQSGLFSLLFVMKNGKSLEVGSVGREGIVGEMVAFGILQSTVRVVALADMEVAAIETQQFRKTAVADPAMLQACVVRNEALLLQARMLSACNAFHSVEARLARFLLQFADRVSSDGFRMTHESIGDVLAVRRTSVTQAARNLLKAGAISYSRGKIGITDRPALIERACECYHKGDPAMLEDVTEQIK
jgi:CRP-like cAMP-binding protein